MSQHSTILLLSDFDQTVAKTIEQSSPRGIDVSVAYRLALEEMFGSDGFALYEELGGLKNQAPIELIKALLAEAPHLAQQAAHRHGKLGSNPSLEDLTKLLVDLKLNHLVGEICDDWPKPCRGFLELCEELQRLRQRGLTVDLGIITNGHLRFVAKTFKTWGLERPKPLVTEEDVRDLTWPPRPEDRVKPAVYPFNLAMNRWRRFRRGSHPSRVIYFGDDPKRDGGLAVNAAVPFGYFTEEIADISNYPPGSFQFSDWTDVARRLIDLTAKILAGLPCHQIFAHTG